MLEPLEHQSQQFNAWSVKSLLQHKCHVGFQNTQELEELSLPMPLFGRMSIKTKLIGNSFAPHLASLSCITPTDFAQMKHRMSNE